MRFKVFKSSFDGISGGASMYESIDDVLNEIACAKGWNSIKELHAAIRKWAETARPGASFCTHVTAIVAIPTDLSERTQKICLECGLSACLEYGPLVYTATGNVEQCVHCTECDARWSDIFALAEQRRSSLSTKKA